MRTLILVCCIAAILSTACENKTKRYYYDSGEIKEERILSQKSDTSTYILESYYKNGQLKAKGQVVKGVNNGLWQEWYSDGAFKWTGKYVDGIRIIKNIPPKATIKLKNTDLIAGVKTSLKISIKGIHPSDILLGCTNAILKVSEDQAYDFDVTPQQSGQIRFYFAILSDTTMGLYPIDTLIAK